MQMRQAAKQGRRDRRIAVRTAQQDRKQDRRLERANIAAQKESAAALAGMDEQNYLPTEVIDDTEARRRRAMAGRSAYGFASTGGGYGLGGGSTQLG